MARNWPSLILITSGFTLLGLGAILFLASRSGPVLTVEETDLTLEDVPSDEDYQVVYRLHNHSSKPIRLVGLGEC